MPKGDTTMPKGDTTNILTSLPRQTNPRRSSAKGLCDNTFNNIQDLYSSAKGVTTNTHGMKEAKMDNPSSLLPNDTNSQWAALNPNGNGALKSVNLLQAGSLVGINTVGSSLRNANLQLRSDPPNPQGQVSPWNQTTIQPDTNRQPLEIGGKM
jgi:hypothetical protein